LQEVKLEEEDAQIRTKVDRVTVQVRIVRRPR
jgi:hypothetical protein